MEKVMIKKIFIPAVVTALMCFAGCQIDDGPELIIDPVMTTTGVFVVNTGVWPNNTGTLSFLPLNENKVYNNVFFEVNGQYVGDTFNDGLVTSDKIYLAVNGSNVIQVVDRGTMKQNKTIEFGGAANGPRRLTEYEGNIYVTLFSGYLAKIDATTMTVSSTVEVGPNPEAVVGLDGKLYVAVSDALNSAGGFSGACVAVVDPAKMIVTEKIEAGINLTDLATNGRDLFVLSSGEYEPITWKQINYGVKQIKGHEVTDILFPATYMAMRDETIYYIDNAYLVESTTYGKYDVKSGKSSSWIAATEVKSPAGFNVNVDSGDVYMLSNSLGEGGYVDYTAAGYMVRYDADGKYLGRYDVGVCPTRIFFARDEK